MLTIQASGWNKRKAENLDRTLAKRYIKTVQRITEATKDLEKLTTELSLQQDTVHQWVSDVQQWTSGGNKQRHQLRRKIAVEKKALEVAINEHNAAVGGVEKLPPPNELLAVDNYSWPWECHGDMERKKNVFDKMTKTKDQGVCPVCGKSLSMVAKHIRQTHMVRNKVERAILDNMATSLTVIPPGPCPIPVCTPHVLHVAKHLKGHSDITVRRIETELAKVKKAAAIAATLSHPWPPALMWRTPGRGITR
ncbi:hypothetical protein D5F01_LYC23778 [Larimichthys crocea]|uniref:Uncharacterized protein n=1 Tax=Larimichthys crocea TaxID=215358 RepID=A0A6G0HFX8_LARCR|nr:hypothetical protein D5F01_LYC23778 [Larimichthys crocea]